MITNSKRVGIMKKYIISICWIIGAIIWSIIAWTYFSEDKTVLVLVQIIIAFLFFVHGIRECISKK